MRKGILLAGGKGTRLYPLSASINKHFLPVYNKPMIYYPLCTLMQAGVKEVLLIGNPQDIPLYQRLLKNGRQWGMHIEYAVQEKADGIAQAFIIGKGFLNNHSSMLVLGDNIFYGGDLTSELRTACIKYDRSTIFAYRVSDPERYGVVDFDKNFRALSIEEKPAKPKSNYAVTGIYFYDEDAPALAAKLRPSKRGELEITDLNNVYMKSNLLDVVLMSTGTAWLDTGTFASLLQASSFIETIETRQALLVGSPDVMAIDNGWITREQYLTLVATYPDNPYKQALMRWVE